MTTWIVHVRDPLGEQVTLELKVPDTYFEVLEQYADTHGLSIDEALTKAVNDYLRELLGPADGGHDGEKTSAA